MYLKKFGLAMLSLAAVVGCVGAGSAAAETTLCKAAEQPCGVGNSYGSGTVLKGSASGHLELGSTGGGSAFTVECSSSALEATLENVVLQGGNPGHLVPTDFWVLQSGSGFFCPPHLMWIDSYEFSQPKPLYVTKG